MDAPEAKGAQPPVTGFAARAASWVESAADAVACIDAEQRVIYVNRAWCEMTGRESAACLGARVSEWRPFGSGTDRVITMIEQAAAGDRRVEGEIQSDAGAVLGVSVRPDREADGAVAGYVVAVRDMSRYKEIERALRDSQTDFRTLADSSPDNIVRYGADGRATYCNPALLERLGADREHLIGRRADESRTTDQEQTRVYQELVMRAITSGEAGHIDMTVRARSGEERIHSILIRAERDHRGDIRGALAIGRDITEMVLARQALADKEREFRSLAENATDNIGRWDREGRLVYANPALAALFGAPLDELRGRRGVDLASTRFVDVAAAVERVIRFDHVETVETRFTHPMDGREHVHLVRLVPEHDDEGRLVSVLGIGHDISDIVRQRETLEHMARTDALTGVANRQLLYERAGDLFVDARARRVGVGLMLLDLDGFKHVNDRLGHRAGDDLLRMVSQRLQGCLRERDLLVRLGGDEFVIVVTGVHDRNDLSKLADRVRISLAEITAAGGSRFARVDASIGVAMFPHDGATMDVLLARADVAMYEAKRNGRGRMEHFRPELAVAMERRAAIEQELAACDFDAGSPAGFDIHLQPIFRLDDPPVVVAAEALARWTHPALGVVTPAEFIPVAEESGRIVQLGRWALQRSAEMAARCNAGRPTPLIVGVNVSTRQFALDDVVAATDEALALAGCDPSWLLIEITESLLLEDSMSVRNTLDALRERGVAIAIDDFGMGYSALHYLSRFPVDDLKIDRAFTAGIGEGARRTELVRAFVALAGALDLDVIAEGIETDDQLRFLQEIGCAHGQGYLLASPMPIGEFETFDRSRRTSPVA